MNNKSLKIKSGLKKTEYTQGQYGVSPKSSRINVPSSSVLHLAEGLTLIRMVQNTPLTSMFQVVGARLVGGGRKIHMLLFKEMRSQLNYI